MTRPLAGGWLLVAPADAGTVAALAREGARAIAGRRPLPRRAADVLDALTLAAADARSAAGTIPGPCSPRRASSTPTHWINVEEAAAVLKTSTGYVRRLCRSGALAAEKLGPAWQVDADAVTARALDTPR